MALNTLKCNHLTPLGLKGLLKVCLWRYSEKPICGDSVSEAKWNEIARVKWNENDAFGLWVNEDRGSKEKKVEFDAEA